MLGAVDQVDANEEDRDHTLYAEYNVRNKAEIDRGDRV